MRSHGFLVSVFLLLLASAALAEGDATRGEATYADLKCITCHSLGDQAGPMAHLGGAMDGIGSRHDAAWLTSFLTDSKSVMPDAKLHPAKPSSEQIADLVAYLLTLAGDEPASGEAAGESAAESAAEDASGSTSE